MFQQITQVAKHSTVYSIGQVLQRVVSFLLIPMYTTYFTTSDYGVLEILNNTSSILTTLLGLGLVSGMYRSYFMHTQEGLRRGVVKTALSVFGIISVLIGGSLITIAGPLSKLLLPGETFSSLLVLTLCYIMLANIIAIPFAVLRTENRSVLFVVFSLVQFSVNAGSTIYLVAVVKRGVRGSLEGNLLGQLIVLLLFVPLLLKILKARFSLADLKEMLTFGLPLVPAMLASISLTVSDRYFLQVFSTFDEIGVYGLGYKIGLMVQVLVATPFALSWGPVMWSVSDKPYAKQLYARVLTYFVAIALYIALILSVLSPELVHLMSRREAYWRAWQVVPLITLSYVFYGVYYQMAVGINLRKKTQYLPLVVGAAAGLNLALNFALIPRWGMMGAATSTVVSYLALVLLVYVVSQRFYPFPYEWGRLFKLTALSVVCYIACRFVASDSLLASIGLKSLLLLLYPLALFGMRFFTAEELTRGHQLGETGWRKFRGWLHENRVFGSRN